MRFALTVVSLFYLANACIASSHLDYHIILVYPTDRSKGRQNSSGKRQTMFVG